MSVWLPGSILNFRIGSVSSIGGLIAATLFADTASDSQFKNQISSPVVSTKFLKASGTSYVDTEYDRAKVPPYNGHDPRSPLVV